MTVAVGLGLMDFPFETTSGFWRFVDMAEAGGADSIWQTDRIVSPTPILQCMTAVAAIAATSGVALYVCKPIPDAWAAPAVLALHLLVSHSPSLAKWEHAALAVIIVFAGAAHMATFGVLAGLSVLCALAWLARRCLGLAPRIDVAIMAVWSGPLLLLVGNIMVAGQLTLGSDGEIFLFARMVEDGMAADILAEECPRVDWQLCRYRDALRTFWNGGGESAVPLQEIARRQEDRRRPGGYVRDSAERRILDTAEVGRHVRSA